MTGMEKIYFSPGANPPFPGYEDWLEAVKRAPIWQATGPRCYVPDMRDGLGKELFPPPPPRSNLEPEFSRHYERDIAIAAIDFIWATRHDLVWETMWWLQYHDDDPDEGDRVTKERKYDTMFRSAISYELGKRFANFENFAKLEMLIEIQRQLESFSQHLPLSIRRAPWVGADGLIPNQFDLFKIGTSMNKRRAVLGAGAAALAGVGAALVQRFFGDRSINDGKVTLRRRVLDYEKAINAMKVFPPKEEIDVEVTARMGEYFRTGMTYDEVVKILEANDLKVDEKYTDARDHRFPEQKVYFNPALVSVINLPSWHPLISFEYRLVFEFHDHVLQEFRSSRVGTGP